MKQQTINLKYSLAKARALGHYLEKEGRTIEGELYSHMDRLYETEVPDTVREFLATEYPDVEPKEQVSGTQKQESAGKTGTKKKHNQKIEGPNNSGPVLSM